MVVGSLAVRRFSEGPPLVLVHGGAGPELTWSAQESLAARWALVIPWRRGFPPSPAAGRQDFDSDADDLVELLDTGSGAHLVGFSYGGLAAAIVSARQPTLVRSLTLIEPPLFAVARNDPQVRELMALADAATGMRPDKDERATKAFYELAALGGPKNAAERARTQWLARGLRPPGEAEPDLGAIAEAGIPVLVVSGAHHPAVETICDAVAERTAARRERLPGAGHAAQRAPGFNALLEDFLESGR